MSKKYKREIEKNGVNDIAAAICSSGKDSPSPVARKKKNATSKVEIDEINDSTQSAVW